MRGLDAQAAGNRALLHTRIAPDQPKRGEFAGAQAQTRQFVKKRLERMQLCDPQKKPEGFAQFRNLDGFVIGGQGRFLCCVRRHFRANLWCGLF